MLLILLWIHWVRAVVFFCSSICQIPDISGLLTVISGLITCILPVADAFGAGGIEGDVWAGAGNKSGWLWLDSAMEKKKGNAE